MTDPGLDLYLILAIAGLLAGLLDAVAGGGGLIQIPALFGVYPNVAPATLFGTNKLASIFGTGVAARTFWKTVPLDLTLLLPSTISALLFSFVGAWAMSIVPADVFRKILPVILALVALHVFRHKDFGVQISAGFSGRAKTIAAIVLGATMGFYDGFFGPGTGSFLVFFLVRFFGQDFLRASASAKIINVACNLAALVWFVPNSTPLWAVAALMAVSNMAGAWLGVRLAIKEGATFVRKVFLVAVLVLIAKTAWDAFSS
jgi:uncharacterized membrane protein YfcA